jgi:hypothetical protein
MTTPAAMDVPDVLQFLRMFQTLPLVLAMSFLHHNRAQSQSICKGRHHFEGLSAVTVWS